MWHYQLFSSWGENHQGAQLERLTVGIVISIFQGNYSRFWHGLGRVWDSLCGAFPQKTQKNPAKRFAPNALIPAACEGETRDLNWAAKNRRSELAAALRLFRSRLNCRGVGLSCRLWRIHSKHFGLVVSETVPVWVSSLVDISR